MIIYENNSYWVELILFLFAYFLFMTSGFVALSKFHKGKQARLLKNKRGKSNSFYYFGVVNLSLAVLTLTLIVIPYLIDIPYQKDEVYGVFKGELESIELKDVSDLNSPAVIVVSGLEFKLTNYAPHYNLKRFVDKEVSVFYLPKTKKIAKIELAD